MKRKCLTIGIILLFVGVTIAPAIAQNTEKSQSTSRGNWLYVGGSGPGNYSRIQDAVNDSSNGDTVFVFDDSAPYFESLIINKSITLLGENRNTTIIDGTGLTTEKMIDVQASNVIITEVCIQHSLSNPFSGLYIQGEMCTVSNNIFQHNQQSALYLSYDSFYVTVSNNIFLNNSVGLLLDDGGGNHTILNNIFINNGFSIYASQSHGNTIQGNTILNSSTALLVIESHYNTFTENLLTGNDEGVFSFLSCKNIYYRNEISNNDIGIYFFISQQNTIEENNFIDNEHHASIVYVNFVELLVSVYYKLHYSKNSKFLSLIGRNVWDANYWSDWESTLPKPIQRGIYLLGLQFFLSKIAGQMLPFPIPQFDWHPAQEPYDIPRMT